MRLNKYFKREEFQCKGENCHPSGVGNCGFATVDVHLLEALTGLRVLLGKPVIINSACRCETHNKAVGGSDKSKHKEGIAADIVITGVNPKDIYNLFNMGAPESFGLGDYETFTHIDVRPEKARW